MITDLDILRGKLIDITGNFLTPIRGCDYFIEIYENEEAFLPVCTNLLVTGFKIPINDIAFNSGAESAYILTPSIQVQPMSFEYVIFNENIIKDLYLKQYSNGLLKIRSKRDRPRIIINMSEGPYYQPIMSITGCTFSYPKPEISLESTKLSKYSVDVNFCELKLC